MQWPKYLWKVGGVGCMVVAGFACLMVIMLALGLVGTVVVAVNEGASILSPVPHAHEFLVALATDDMDKAASLSTMSTTPQALQNRLPSQLMRIAQLGGMSDFYAASNGYGWVEYHVMLDDTTRSRVRLNMRVVDGEWRVSNASLLAGE